MEPLAAQKTRELGNAGAAVILSLWGCLMRAAYQRQHEREREDERRGISIGTDRSKVLLPENRRKWVDYPMGAWLVENAAVWSYVLARFLVGMVVKRAGGRARLRGVIDITMIVAMPLLMYHTVANRLYAHIPYFVPGERCGPKSVWEFVVELLTLSWPSFLVLPFIGGKGRHWGSAKARQPWSLQKDLRHFRPLVFCAKLAIARSITDLGFWIGHYLIHLKAIYPLIHKRHHQHYNPSIWTNLHFTFPDILIEAQIPIAIAITSVGAMCGRLTRLETRLLEVYLCWLEAMSHAGKPLPCSSLVAPIAPIYHAVLGDIDRRNVEFHHSHHEILRCNYSITQWPDHLFGTTRFNTDGKSGASQSAPGACA